MLQCKISKQKDNVLIEFFVKQLEKLQDHNSEAYKVCKNDLLKLRKAFEGLNKAFIDRHGYKAAILLAQNILEEFQEHLLSLSFKSFEVNGRVNQSLELINRMERYPMNDENSPCFIAVEILMLWGEDLGREYKIIKIHETEKQLKKKKIVFTIIIFILFGILFYWKLVQQS